MIKLHGIVNVHFGKNIFEERINNFKLDTKCS